MKIHIIRHAATIEWEQKMILWELYGTLSEQGKLKYEKIILENFSKIFPEKIYHSPLGRSRKSAEIWQKFYKNISLAENFLLTERKAGKSEWKYEDEINWGKYEEKPFLERKHEWWESFSEVIIRARKFLEFLKNQKENEILIVGHSAWIFCFLSVIFNENLEKIMQLYKNFEIISIEI